MYPKILLGVLLLCAPLVESLALTPAEILQQHKERIALLEIQLTSDRQKLEVETAVLERHQLNLAEARDLLQSTQLELAAAAEKAKAAEDESSQRELRRVSDRFDRHEAKVERYLERERESSETISRLQTEIAALESDRSKHRNEISRLSQLVSASQTKSTPSAAKTAKPASNLQLASLGKTPPVGTQKKSQKPASWPYLSEGSAADIAYAQSRLIQLEARKREGKADKPPLKSVAIEARLSFGSAEMEYLGDDIFSLVKTVKAGRQTFTLFNQEHWHTIPASDDDTSYRILFDVSSISQPKLFLFKESLIEM